VSIEGAITEIDIANYLANTPGFFERHAELLASIQLSSPHGQRAVSLQERQMQMLRDRIKGLEAKIMEMIRHGQENVAIADRLHRFTRAMMLAGAPAGLPGVLTDTLRHEFMIPQAALRLWGVDPAYQGQAFAQPVDGDTQAFTANLNQPYCGINAGLPAVDWLADAGSVMSAALIPLRAGPGEPTFGLLVLASPDPTRYTADMGTEFLARIGEVCSAALTRLLPGI
jgi:hypothetical protein